MATLCLCSLTHLWAQQQTSITVYAPVLAPEDTLQLFLQSDRITQYFRNPARIIQASNQNGVFHFDLPNIGAKEWVSLNLSYQTMGVQPLFYMMEEFLLERGDSIALELTPKVGVYRSVEAGYTSYIPIIKENWDARFSGRGAAKFQALWAIKILKERLNGEKIEATLGNNIFTLAPGILKIQQEQAMEVLNYYQTQLSPENYRLLQAQVKGEFGEELGRWLERGKAFHMEDDSSGVIRKQLDHFLAQAWLDLQAATEADSFAPRYVDYLGHFGYMLYADARDKKGLREHWYYFLKNRNKASRLRDRILTWQLLTRFAHQPKADVLEDALETMNDPFALRSISPLKTLLTGTKAYAFVLPDAQDKYHKLDDYKGKIVFMDFWYAACGPCKYYLKNVVKPVKAYFKDNPNVVFITVSIDNAETFKSVVKRGDLLPAGGIHLYTDNQFSKHPIIQHYQLSSYPHPMLIGKDGRLSATKLQLKKETDLIEQIERALAQ